MRKRHGLALGFMYTVILFSGSVQSAMAADAAPVSADTVVVLNEGSMSLEWDYAKLSANGVRVHTRGNSAATIQGEQTFDISAESSFEIITNNGQFSDFGQGALVVSGGLLIGANDKSLVAGPIVLARGANGQWVLGDGPSLNDKSMLDVVSIASNYSPSTRQFDLVGEVALHEGAAHSIGVDQLARETVGRIRVSVSALVAAPVEPVPNTDGGVATSTGPDVIVGDLPDVDRWGRVNGITAYSVATTSCNIGTERLGWHANTNDHPVIGQNMYRLKNGRFEQIGLSWLKHGFFALSNDLCSQCNDPTNGSELGVGCSDPYSAGLNGEQGNLGPRFQVNPSSGFYPYPWSVDTPPAATVGRRLQVKDEYLDPDLNSGAIYFVEGHYITPDDAVVGGDSINNAHNNASYRRVSVVEQGANIFNVNVTATTQREKPAIVAWRDFDNTVSINYADVANDGRLIVGQKVTDLGNGFFHYEFAVQNLNSDRSAGSFSVPIPIGVAVTNIEAHYVSDHSGAPYDSSPWTATLANGTLSWATTPYDGNPNSNALRWGCMYNFRFDANAAPTQGEASIGLFKPGAAPSITVPASVPDLALAVTESFPPTDAIDARQPSDVNGGNVIGWQFIDLSFNGYALNLTPDQFAVSQDGGVGPAPQLLAFLPVEENKITAVLDRTISTGAWTTITHVPSGTSTRLGFLPADVNGDGTSSPVDILALIDALNGVGPELAIWSTDINRSGLAEPSDILRVIDLLNGAGEFDVYNGATLP